MTVLLKLCDDLDKRINSQDANSDYEKGILIGLNAAANIVSSYLPAEEQQIKDAWKAGQNYSSAISNNRTEGNMTIEVPADLKTYIKNLKQKA